MLKNNSFPDLPCLTATSSEVTVVTTFLCSLPEIIYVQINTYKLFFPLNGSILYMLLCTLFFSVNIRL